MSQSSFSRFLFSRSHSEQRMAEDERDEGAAHEGAPGEDEEWTEPADLEGLDDGPTTVFVGSFSYFHTIASALEAIKRPADKMVVLAGAYEGDVTIDTTVRKNLSIQGDSTVPRSSVVIKGKLILTYSEPAHTENAEPEPTEAEDKKAPAADESQAEGEGDNEGEPQKKKPKRDEPPKLLSITHLWFMNGADFTAQTNALLSDCQLGPLSSTAAPSGAPTPPPRTVVCHALSTVRVSASTVCGCGKSAIYMYPRARCVLEGCEIAGYVKPPPASEETTKRKKIPKSAVPLPPPVPQVPTKCECECGLYCDDSEGKLMKCTIQQCDIGVVCHDVCRGTVLEECTVQQMAAVGLLLDKGSCATVRKCIFKLCGRDAVIIGAQCHPIMRSNVMVGSVRVKHGASFTGICDNVVGCDGAVVVEDATFAVKGFQVVSVDPTVAKPKKKAPEAE